jgi:hypothetical protein
MDLRRTFYIVLSCSISIIFLYFETFQNMFVPIKKNKGLNMTQHDSSEQISASMISPNFTLREKQKLRTQCAETTPRSAKWLTSREPSHKLTGCISVQMPWYAMTFQT